MNDLGLKSLVSGADALAAAGTSINQDVATGASWGSLLGLAAPAAAPTPPTPNANGTVTPAASGSGIMATLTKYAGVVVVGALSIVVLGVLALKGR